MEKKQSTVENVEEKLKMSVPTAIFDHALLRTGKRYGKQAKLRKTLQAEIIFRLGGQATGLPEPFNCSESSYTFHLRSGPESNKAAAASIRNVERGRCVVGG
jgi:hypothetical protein